MLSCLLFCFLESENFVFKAPNIIYSTLWRQSHQHSDCPDLFIRFLLVLYHKPIAFSKCETKTRKHNRTASKWACAFPTPTWAPHSLPPSEEPQIHYLPELLPIHYLPGCAISVQSPTASSYHPLQLMWVFALYSTGEADFDLLVSLCWYSGSLCHPQPRGATLILQHCKAAIAQHEKNYRGDKLCKKRWGCHAFTPLISAQTSDILPSPCPPTTSHNKNWIKPRPQAMSHLL